MQSDWGDESWGRSQMTEVCLRKQAGLSAGRIQGAKRLMPQSEHHKSILLR